jgi:hypothetical protein
MGNVTTGMSVARNHRLLAGLRRVCAAGSAALILALGLFAVCPSLHEQLHHGADATAPDQCAVVLFAGGVSVPLAVAAPLLPVADWRELRALATAEILLDSPRYLLRPERGPPVA